MNTRVVRVLMRLLRRRGNRPTIDELKGPIGDLRGTIARIESDHRTAEVERRSATLGDVERGANRPTDTEEHPAGPGPGALRAGARNGRFR
jgi:hypothetical protein